MICPRCFLEMPDDIAQQAISLDGKIRICTTCGQIESLEQYAPHLAEGLRVGQRRVQAALYGLDKTGKPNLPFQRRK